MTALVFTVPGKPETWKRTAMYGGRKLTPAKQRQFQAKVRAHALAAMLPGERRVALDASLRFSVALLIAKPTAVHADADNYQKNLGDSLNGIVWKDDSQVVDWHVRMVVDRANPRLDVVIAAHRTEPAPWTLAGMRESLAGPWVSGDPTEPFEVSHAP